MDGSAAGLMGMRQPVITLLLKLLDLTLRLDLARDSSTTAWRGPRENRFYNEPKLGITYTPASE